MAKVDLDEDLANELKNLAKHQHKKPKAVLSEIVREYFTRAKDRSLPKSGFRGYQFWSSRPN